MAWTNYGDVNPMSGSLFVRNAELDGSGDFQAEAIETVPETNIGGDESRALIRQGNIHLSVAIMAPALETVGARIDGADIVRPGHHGEEERVPMTSEEGMRELSHAAHAYCGIETWQDSLIQIGEHSEYDAERKFPGDLTIYPQGASIWKIIENEMDDFRSENVDGFPADELGTSALRIEDDTPSP